ncbi:MAG: hypothetical protein Q7U00_00805 [Sulfurimonas sp.]|nr:hypothetical protein [Sulfurimonas sp.]
MIISGKNDIFSAYARVDTSSIQQQTVSSIEVNSTDDISSNSSYNDKVTISDAAKAIMAESQAKADAQEIQKRLDAIKAKPAVQRSSDEVDFVSKNDKRLAQISSKDPKTITAEELDYQQKTGGFVNTMATLSATEKALYNELVAKGDYEAATGMNLIALSRTGMEGQEVQLPNGQSFDPMNTEITAGNIRKFFQYIFVDPTGEMNRRFEALATYLEQRPTYDKQS